MCNWLNDWYTKYDHLTIQYIKCMWLSCVICLLHHSWWKDSCILNANYAMLCLKFCSFHLLKYEWSVAATAWWLSSTVFVGVEYSSAVMLLGSYKSGYIVGCFFGIFVLVVILFCQAVWWNVLFKEICESGKYVHKVYIRELH